MAPSPRVGDLLEFRTPAGLAYVQYIHRNNTPPLSGDLIRALPGLFDAPVLDIAQRAGDATSFVLFFPLRVAVRDSTARIVGHTPVPRRWSAFPTFRTLRPALCGEPMVWELWDGKDTVIVDRLTTDQCRLPLGPVMVNDVELTERILEANGRPTKAMCAFRRQQATQFAAMIEGFEKAGDGQSAENLCRRLLDLDATDPAARAIAGRLGLDA